MKDSFTIDELKDIFNGIKERSTNGEYKTLDGVSHPMDMPFFLQGMNYFFHDLEIISSITVLDVLNKYGNFIVERFQLYINKVQVFGFFSSYKNLNESFEYVFIQRPWEKENFDRYIHKHCTYEYDSKTHNLKISINEGELI